MTGCGCLALVAALVTLLVLFIRGSTDAGAPFEQSVAVLLALAAVTRAMHRSRTMTSLVAKPSAACPADAAQAVRAIAGTRSRPSARSSAAPTRSTVASS